LKLAAVVLLSSCLLSSGQVHNEWRKAKHKRYPHQVLIYSTFTARVTVGNVENENGKIPMEMLGSGTGTLIADQWVLTAAHLFDSSIEMDGYGYVLHEAEVQQYYGNVTYKAQVDWIVPHESWDLHVSLRDEYITDEMADICLVHLAAPLRGVKDGKTVTAVVQPALLPRENIPDFAAVRFAGYGANDRHERKLQSIGFGRKYPWGNIEGELMPWALKNKGRRPLLESKITKLPYYYCAIFRRYHDRAGFYSEHAARQFYDYFQREHDRLSEEERNPWQDCVGNRYLNDRRGMVDSGDSGSGIFVDPYNSDIGNTIYGIVVAVAVPYREDGHQFVQPSQFVKVAPLVEWIFEMVDGGIEYGMVWPLWSNGYLKWWMVA